MAGLSYGISEIQTQHHINMVGMGTVYLAHQIQICSTSTNYSRRTFMPTQVVRYLEPQFGRSTSNVLIVILPSATLMLSTASSLSHHPLKG